MLKKHFCLLIMNLIFTSAAWAIQVTIDPVNYSGEWRLSGRLSQTGLQTLDLPLGRNVIQVAATGSITFNVEDSGRVTSSNFAAATGGQNRLTLKNQTISFDANGFAGKWAIAGIASFQNSGASVVLTPNLPYRFAFGGIGTVDATLDKSGVLVANNLVSFRSTPGEVQFNVLDVEIDPVEFLGSYFIPGVTVERLSGGNNINLVLGARYQVNIGVDTFHFLINDYNSISILNDSRAATTNSNRLILANSEIDVLSKGYKGSWAVSLGTGALSGDQTIVLVTDIDFNLFVAGGNQANFKVNASDEVQVLSGNQAVGGAGTLSFTTVKVNIDPFNYNELVVIEGINRSEPVYQQAGSGEVILVANLAYALFLGGLRHNVEVGTLSSEVINVTADSGINFSYELAVEPPPTTRESCEKEANGKWKPYLKCISRSIKQEFKENALTRREARALYKELFIESIDVYDVKASKFKKYKTYIWFYIKIFKRKRRIFQKWSRSKSMEAELDFYR